MYGGPIGLLLGYIVMGTIVYCVMITLGEMVCFPRLRSYIWSSFL
jgi:amino acid transporter